MFLRRLLGTIVLIRFAIYKGGVVDVIIFDFEISKETLMIMNRDNSQSINNI
jgi:hypothetical protein